MRILQLGKFYPVRGGIEKVMHDLMTGLSEYGVECDMLCALDGRGSRTFSVNRNARLIGCGTWKKVAATMLSPSMLSILRKECHRYDVIHIHHPDPMACLALFFSGYKGRVILHWHSDIQKQKLLLGFYRPLQNWLLSRCDLIIGTTPVYLTDSPELENVQGKSVCLPIGVEPIRFRLEEAEKIRDRYQGKKIIFSLGRLVAYKGYRYLIESAKYLDDDYVVLIGGTGPLKEELQREIENLGLIEKVILLGRVSDEELPAYYGACKLFCLSSVQKTEAFGIVQIEAMSCAKPVVATNIPGSGVSWVNAHGVSGLNVIPGNASELAEAIKAITVNEDVYREYSMRAEKRYHDVFTKEQMINGILKIYRKLWKE